MIGNLMSNPAASMKFYDIFNGDADGICALHQLRLEQPRAAELVTGAKRDIALVERVAAQAGDQLTVLDVSLRSNADAVLRALASGAQCVSTDFPDPDPRFSDYAVKLPGGVVARANPVSAPEGAPEGEVE